MTLTRRQAELGLRPLPASLSASSLSCRGVGLECRVDPFISLHQVDQGQVPIMPRRRRWHTDVPLNGSASREKWSTLQSPIPLTTSKRPQWLSVPSQPHISFLNGAAVGQSGQTAGLSTEAEQHCFTFHFWVIFTSSEVSSVNNSKF